jgi:hypothetical protein
MGYGQLDFSALERIALFNIDLISIALDLAFLVMA